MAHTPPLVPSKLEECHQMVESRSEGANFFFLSLSPPCIFFMVHYSTQHLILPIIETIFRPIDAKCHSPPITAMLCAFCTGLSVVLDAVIRLRSGGARNALSAETDSPYGGNKIYSSILRRKGLV